MSDERQLDRPAAQRVLRAASVADGARDETDLPHLRADRLDAEAIVAAAVDAGIAEADVRRALAVELLGPPPRQARGDALLGPAEMTIDAEVTGTPGEALALLDSWLVSGHHLRRDRLRAGRGAWSRRRGALGTLLRTTRRALGEGRLGDLARIEAIAVDTGSGTSAMRVVVDRHRERFARGAVGASVAATGTATVAIVAALTAPVVLLAAPLAVGAGVGLAATGRRAVNEVSDELDRVIEAVDHGDQPARLGPDIVRRVIGRPGSAPARLGVRRGQGTSPEATSSATRSSGPPAGRNVV